MSINSINTNLAAFSAQANIGRASNAASSSIARLSSGSRIVRASDDVAALSVGTSLRTNVTTLRVALINASQGSSLLQVADGALSQLTEILQRQKSIAVQAGSGSLTSAERGFLNQEFQNLTQEVDRIASQTNFNGVNLLDGTLFDRNDVATQDNAASQSNLRLSFSQNFANVASANLIINGEPITIGTGATDVARGATLEESLGNLVQFLNTVDTANNPGLSEAVFSVENGSDLVIRSRTGGALSNSFTIEAATGANASNALSVSGTGVGGSIATVSGASQSGTSRALINLGNTVTGAGVDVVGLLGDLTFTNSVTGLATPVILTSASIGVTATAQDYVDAINAISNQTGVTANLIGSYTANGLGLELTFNRGESFTVTTGGTLGDTTDAVFGRTIQTVDFGVSSFGATALLNTDAEGAAGTDFLNSAIATAGLAGEIDINGVLAATVAAGDNIANILTEIQASGVNVRATIGTLANGNLGLILASDEFTDIDITGALGTAATEGTSSSLLTAQGGANDGLGIGSTIGIGTAGDSLITTQNQLAASSTLAFLSSTTPAALVGETISFGDGNATTAATTGLFAGNVTFEFVDASTLTGSLGENQIAIGSTLEETLDNLVNRINTFSGSSNYVVSQLEARRDGNDVTFTNRTVGNVFNRDQSTVATITVSTNLGNGTEANLSNASFNNGINTGVNTSGINNAAFVGTIQGFSASYASTPDRVNLSIQIGDELYTASSVNTNVTTPTTVRLVSENGGYFDIQFAANNGSSVSSQTNADAFARRLDEALSTITFFQSREFENFIPTGLISGSSLSLRSSDFSEVNATNVSVSAPTVAGTDAIIEFTINGETYRNEAGIGGGIAANSVTRFVNTANALEFVEFRTGDVAVDFSDASAAAAFETALETALGVGSGGQSIGFQVGITTQDTLNVSIGTVTTDVLFGGQSLDVLTQASAAAASDVLDEAIDVLTSVRAEVGAIQSRFNFATANVQSALQNQDAARGVLLDTDVAAESTAFATAQVQLQAGISVLAQANLLPQNLLKLIG